jgi:hypothetical protein
VNRTWLPGRAGATSFLILEPGVASQVAVSDSLEVVQQPNCFLIYKREVLHQDHGTPTPLGVDPIEGVIESRPSKAACRSPAKAGIC